MTDDSVKISLVDEALLTAQADPKLANVFFDAFLNAEVFVPALRADKRPGEWSQLSIKDRFFPLYLTQDENRIIPVFDSLERLKAWSQDKTFDFLALRSHLLLRVIAPEIAIILNEGTPYRYLFIPDALEQLRAQMKPVNPN